MKDKTIKRILVFFFAISAVLIAVAVRAVLNINRSMDSADWVNHTHSVILEIEGLRSDLALADGAMHTFVLTGDARDQGAARSALASVSDHVEIAKALTRQEPDQNAQVTQIEAMVDKHTTYVRDVMEAKQAGSADPLRTLLADDSGRSAVQEIAQKIKRLKDDEMALLTKRDTASYLQAQTTRWTVWTGVVLDVGTRYSAGDGIIGAMHPHILPDMVAALPPTVAAHAKRTHITPAACFTVHAALDAPLKFKAKTA